MNLQPFPYPTHVSPRPVPHTILLVEDEPFVREATRCILESAGFEVLPAEDAAVAIKVYEESNHAVDLVMTDMILPGRTGEQLGLELRLRSPKVKVLITSGYSNVEFATDEPNSRTYFLAKPYSRRCLVDKIEEIFRVLPLHTIAGHAG